MTSYFIVMRPVLPTLLGEYLPVRRYVYPFDGTLRDAREVIKAMKTVAARHHVELTFERIGRIDKTQPQD